MMISHVFVLWQGTQKQERNELLFQLGVNYNNILQIFRKGTCLIKTEVNVYIFDIVIANNFYFLEGFECMIIGSILCKSGYYIFKCF